MRATHFLILCYLFCSNIHGQCHFLLHKELKLSEGFIRLYSLGSLSCVNSQQNSFLQRKMEQLTFDADNSKTTSTISWG